MPRSTTEAATRKFSGRLLRKAKKSRTRKDGSPNLPRWMRMESSAPVFPNRYSTIGTMNRNLPTPGD